MPRKAFVADLNEAVTSFQRKNVSNLGAGEEDGMINFAYQQGDTEETVITVLVPDLGEYPGSHMYMFYTNSEHVTPEVHSALDSMNDCSGLKIADMMAKIIKTLDKATAGTRQNPVDLDDPNGMLIDSDEEEPEQDEEPSDYEDDDGSWSPKPSTSHQSRNKSTISGYALQQNSDSRIRHDIRLAKAAGFRVGYLGTLLNGGQDGFITLSIRVSKLGISDEALQAWHLEPKLYFIVVIRYTNGYRALDQLLSPAMSHGHSGIQIRVGLNDKYKIKIDQSVAAFMHLSEDKSKTLGSADTDEGPGLDRLFISRPLEELLNDRLPLLLCYRDSLGVSWQGAEEFLNDYQGRNMNGEDQYDPKFWAPDDKSRTSALPKLVIQDHFSEMEKQKSFPLLIMQFALRHLVRCTEFCLVCHCRVDTDFEALKPYVCSKPLCLYQYMSLGFGPSIEHEIINQPHVVDLLISFCYTCATHQKMRHLPTGMALLVPSPSAVNTMSYSSFSNGPDPTGLLLSKYEPGPVGVRQNRSDMSSPPKAIPHRAKLDLAKMELLFQSSISAQVLHIGSWITFEGPKAPNSLVERWHCRVIDTLYPTAKLSYPVVVRLSDGDAESKSTLQISKGVSQRHLNRPENPATITPTTTPPPYSNVESGASKLQDIEFTLYDQNFDDLSDFDKFISITNLLDTLPSVQQMGEYLKGRGAQNALLRHWTEKISPAALGLLRWIIASNRSCIVQVDSVDGSSAKSEERVSGMPGWMQFRFAQGAPDKEQRFISSIKETTAMSKHPTLFAWHGSPLYNWHGIVREGLDFKAAAHGRAYGDGCYHSLQASTSLGYSSMFGSWAGPPTQVQGRVHGQWPQSQLKISSAISLNEIVNAPHKFQSKSPHLVVAQLDWIQTRYLFVRCNIPGMQILDSKPTQVYEQDPHYTPTSDSYIKIVIPVTAVSKSRRPVSKEIKTGFKKVKVGNVQEAERAAMLSDETDLEDIEILFSDEEKMSSKQEQSVKGRGKENAKPSKQQRKTDFVPGKLDHKTLPLITPPSYATSMASKALQKELTSTLKIQNSHPLHELGWYVDPELVSNVYQWIIELHSFEEDLPLAKDMKSKNINSIIMEVRFGQNYPMTPPFVRIIRPRFLSFMQGGGGHVTAGGALCMELLTNSGWSAVNNIESVLLQVRMAISSTDPKPARLEQGPVRDYGVGEAVEAYVRASTAHGWQVPPDIREIAGSSSTLN